MSTKKTAKPQTVTFYRQSPWWRPASITNGATIDRELESIAIYDAEGVMCWLNSCDLGDTLRDGARLEIQLPIIWKTFKAPDYSEARAHIVGRDFYGERKYTLFIPAAAVTVTPAKQYPRTVNKPTGSVTYRYDVEGFPRSFQNWCSHPFQRYAMIHELEALQKDQYNIFTGDDITTPYAKKRISEFIAKLEEYTAEAERIKALSEDEFVAECNASNPRFFWRDGGYSDATTAEDPAA